MTLIDIFRAGRRPDANGNVVNITTESLQQAIDAYNPQFHESPVVIGHPKDNHPAYAWVKGLQLNGDTLQAELTQVDPDFAEMVQNGRFKKVSASFYLPDSPNNPVAGKWYLRHVGFLGAVPPAVKGLRNPEFNEAEQGVVAFSDTFATEATEPAQPNIPNPTPEGENAMSAEEKAELDRLRQENEQLKAAQAKAEAEKAEAVLNSAKAENVSFVEGLISEGKLAPKNKEQVVAMLDAMTTQAAGGVVEFEEGDSLNQQFKAYLNAQPKVVEFEEIATKDKAAPPQDDTVDYAEGTSPASIDADKRIRAYMGEHGVDYTTAFNALFN
ncbi:hypothetical protein [Avibacterium paragallinarum]|uniref:Uncharacterized protein n=1 Tax=Avibacterium paragallinarum TaxID=728 RepID=A0A0F5ENQ9_AVIPA|nr:hypothetical protein [Avibacterium paragallinarum]KAA6209017.1 peptidase [Avibacterium paragallinarum]KKA98223.1 peptidase [Avibacterium paragallinarum]RZN71703.1 peptidase [Avibacterium paragallinarum]SUU98631.1 Uncharacterised protein [Avibacterium paragallinarum]